METLKIKEGFQTDFTVTVKDSSGSVIDLSSYDGVKFYMVDKLGVLKINGSSGSFVGPKTDGVITYSFTALDVDTKGTYTAYFALLTGTTKKLAVPVENFQVEIFEDFID